MNNFIILAILFISSAYVASGSLLDDYKAWKGINGKTSLNGDFNNSFATWCSKKLEVTNHNVRFAQGLETYQKGINRFSDIPTKEFLAKYTGAKPPVKGRMLDEQESEMLFSSKRVGRQLPTSFDWRTKGAVTPVKNQGRCGSCWAFAVVTSIEAAFFRRNNRLVAFSEQNLVDCSTLDNGCNGGWPTNTFQHIIRAGGINTMASYPYRGVKSTCRFVSSGSGFGTRISNFFMVNSGRASESRLQRAVANNGPVVVAIQVTAGFQSYRSGIFFDSSCSKSPNNVNHAVTVVGYGTTGGVNFWIVKNSWGTRWGESGYIRMARNRANNCNIATWNWYSIV